MGKLNSLVMREQVARDLARAMTARADHPRLVPDGGRLLIIR
jgi:hypothetical protein